MVPSVKMFPSSINVKLTTHKFKKNKIIIITIFFFAITIPREQYPRSIYENACNFTLSCSWRRRFNNNNNSKQCYFKNQRWQNNPFSSESKQKSGHLVPVSEWWVWKWWSWETFLPTVPCKRQALSLARVSVSLESARWPGFFFFFSFFGRILEYEKSYSSRCQQCRCSSIRLLIAALFETLRVRTEMKDICRKDWRNCPVNDGNECSFDKLLLKEQINVKSIVPCFSGVDLQLFMCGTEM